MVVQQEDFHGSSAVKNLPAMQEILIRLLDQEDPLEKGQAPTPVFLGFSVGSDGKNSACNVGDLGLIPGSGGSPGGRAGQPTPVFLPRESP